jgi:hypothetical protein
VCGAMYNKQVLVPLQALVPQVSLKILLCCLRTVSISDFVRKKVKDDESDPTFSSFVAQLSERIQLILTEQPLPAGSEKTEGYLDGNQVFALAENVLTLFWCLR